MKKNIIAGLIFSTLVACATSNNPTQKAPGFLPDYALLKPVPSDAGTKIYRYINRDFKRSNYHALIIDPVVIYLPANESGVSPEIIANTKKALNANVKQVVQSKFKLATRAAPGVARIKIAITGAELDGEGFKLRGLIPISAAISLATTASGYANQHALLIIEAKLLDSKSNQLLGEAFNVISSENFRNQDLASQEFAALAQKWVKDSLNNAAADK